MNFNVSILKKPDDIKQCFEVRFEVFIKEQKFDEDIEIDHFDDIAYHVLITNENKAIATARFFLYEDYYKIGRVCVLKKYRNLNVGNLLLKTIENFLKKENVKKIYLSSQYTSKDFYFKNGYKQIGAIYLEEGCKHIKMFKEI